MPFNEKALGERNCSAVQTATSFVVETFHKFFRES